MSVIHRQWGFVPCLCGKIVLLLCSLAPLDCVYVRVSDSNSHCELLLLTGGSIEYTAHSLCSSDALDFRSPEHFIIEKKFLIGI